MIKPKIFICFLVGTIFINFLIGQETSFCFTKTDTNYISISNFNTPLADNLVDPNNIIDVRVFVHILRDDNGNGGQSVSKIPEVLQNLVEDFPSHDICFSLSGYKYIDNSNYYNSLSNALYPDSSAILSENSKNFAINIYLSGNDDSIDGGISIDPPGINLAVGGNIVGRNVVYTKILSHEMGHNFGLKHTHFPEGTGTPEAKWPLGWCRELVNQTNCFECGDRLCDTPADPLLGASKVDTTTCVWDFVDSKKPQYYDENGDHYNPDTRNIMSYTCPQCMSYFTNMQGAAMRSAIATNSILQNTLIQDDETINSLTVDPSETVIRHARNTLTTDGSIEVERGGTLSLTAANTIVLKPGFHAKTGSNVAIYTKQSSCNINP